MRWTPLVVCLFLTGCFGDTSDAEQDGEGEDGAETVTRSVAFAERAGVGEVLVDDAGWTLYVFTNDEEGRTHCSGACARAWPPFLAEAIEGPASLDDRLGLIERPEGMQVALDGMPLYHFEGDAAPGDTSGDAVNGLWFMVRPVADPLDLLGDEAVESGDVTYYSDVQGYWATAEDATLGIVMIHEWWGLTPEIKAAADDLASHGYAVLAVDLFDGNVAQNSSEALAQVQSLDQDEAIRNMQAAASYLRQQGASEVVSHGWCFGGGQSLHLGLSGEQLAGTVLYYGNLVNDTDALSAIEWPVLGVFGEDDAVISVPDVRTFEAGLDAAGIDNQIVIYPDVGHAFANPTGANYSPWQTQDAWLRMLAFLDTL